MSKYSFALPRLARGVEATPPALRSEPCPRLQGLCRWSAWKEGSWEGKAAPREARGSWDCGVTPERGGVALGAGRWRREQGLRCCRRSGLLQGTGRFPCIRFFLSHRGPSCPSSLFLLLLPLPLSPSSIETFPAFSSPLLFSLFLFSHLHHNPLLFLPYFLIFLLSFHRGNVHNLKVAISECTIQ